MTNNDDSIHSKLRSFGEWWNAVRANYEDKRLIVHFGNEPKSNYGLLSTYSIDGMNTLYKEGHHGVFGNFAVGNPETTDLQTTLKPMMQRLESYEGYHFLGVHEYWMHSILLSEPFEISRYKEIEKLYPKIKYIFTEYGTDFIQDIKTHNLSIADTTGYKDYNNDEYVFNEIKNSLSSVYNQDNRVLGLCYFCMGNSGGWEKYDAQNFQYLFDHAGELMTEINVNLGATTTIQSTDPTTGTNRRTGAGTQFPIKGAVIGAVLVSQLQVSGDWIQFHFSDGDYWVNKNYIKISSKTNEIVLTVYDAPDEDVEALKTALGALNGLLGKYRVEFK